MDMNIITSYVSSHQQYVYGIATGWIISNPMSCAVFLFNAFTKIPGVGAWIAENPEKAKGWFDDFDKAIDSQVDKYSKNKAPNKTTNNQ